MTTLLTEFSGATRVFIISDHFFNPSFPEKFVTLKKNLNRVVTITSIEPLNGSKPCNNSMVTKGRVEMTA